MQKRSGTIAAALSVLICGSPLLTGCSTYDNNTAFQNAVEKHIAGDYLGAITHYNKELEVNPKDEDVYYNRGNAKNKLGDYSGAISDYNKTI